MRGAWDRFSNVPNFSASSGVIIGVIHSRISGSECTSLWCPKPNRIAASTASRSKSINRSDAENRSSISGWACANSYRRGASYLDVNAGPAVTVNVLLSLNLCVFRHADDKAENPSVTPGASIHPASVNSTARFKRRNTGSPRWVSSDLI